MDARKLDSAPWVETDPTSSLSLRSNLLFRRAAEERQSSSRGSPERDDPDTRAVGFSSRLNARDETFDSAPARKQVVQPGAVHELAMGSPDGRGLDVVERQLEVMDV